MRRALPALVVIAAVVAAVILIASSGSSSGYRFAAIFDDAKGMVSGQQVKIAGAVVGTVQSVTLASGPKARIVMSIDRRFAPLPAGTRCTILPEGLISEYFVQCVPGASRGALPLGPGGIPTVPLADTTVPFSLQDVLNVFSAPTDQRLGVLISELGIGTAGRGADINALLRRADPTLVTVDRALSIVNAQRAAVAQAVGQTDAVLGQLAARSAAVREFVDTTAAVTRTTARHSTAFGEAVNRLPALLGAARPGLAALDRAVANTTPLLGQLQRAAPGLTELTSTLPPFAHAGTPALHALASATRAGIPAVTAATPVVDKLQTALTPMRTLAPQLAQLLRSSRDSGAFEGTLRVLYAFATNTSLYDNVSHILTFIVSVAPLCVAGQETGISVPGCSHDYYAPGQGQIPLNEPGCGAKSAEWWNVTCKPVAPGPIALRTNGPQQFAQLQSLVSTALSGHQVDRARLGSLLTYLLK